MGDGIAVLRVGNGGCTISAHLALSNHQVNLFEISVFYSTVGKKVSVKIPVCDAIINFASVVNQENCWETRANIEKMFVGSWSMDKLTEFLFEGKWNITAFHRGRKEVCCAYL